MRTCFVAPVVVLMALAPVATACGGSDATPSPAHTAANGTVFNNADATFAGDLLKQRAEELSLVDLTVGRDLAPAFTAFADQAREARSTDVQTVTGGRLGRDRGRPHALVVAPTGSGKTLARSCGRSTGWPRRRRPRTSTAAGSSTSPAQGARRRRRAQPARAADRHPARRRAARAPVGARRSRSASAPATPRPTSGAGFARTPPDILITTPESLFLMLTSQARESLRGVETVIVDEVHAVAGTKRGAHLALSSSGSTRCSTSRRSGSACRRPCGRSRRSPGSSAGRRRSTSSRRRRQGARPRGRRPGRGHDRARPSRRGVRGRPQGRPAPVRRRDLAASSSASTWARSTS
jgi:hypothetical protein